MNSKSNLELYMEITDEGIDTIIPINLDNYKK